MVPHQSRIVAGHVVPGAGRLVAEGIAAREVFRHVRGLRPEEGARHAGAGVGLRDLRVAEVVHQDLIIEDGKVEAYRTKLSVSFKYAD